MKKRKLILPALLSLLIISGCGKKMQEQPVAVWVIGEVTLQKSIGSIGSLKVGDILEAGDEITTSAYSHAALQIGDSIMVKIDRNTTLAVSVLIAGKEHEVFLKTGKVFSKVKKLAPGFEYRVKTPSIIAAVRGTSFSVSSGKTVQKVSVAEGLVKVSREKSDMVTKFQKDAPAGTTLVVTDTVKERPISETEKFEIQKVSIVPYMKGAETFTGKEYDLMVDKLGEQHDDIDKKIKNVEVPKSLTEVKQKYGRVDEITLYNGKVYKGVILKRGVTYTILTTGGKVYVPKKNVRSTRVVR